MSELILINICFLKGRHDSINRNVKIVGGMEVNPGEMPWMVFLTSASQSIDGSTVWRGICSGSLINDQWILTSAGCVGETGLNWLFLFQTPITFKGD